MVVRAADEGRELDEDAGGVRVGCGGCPVDPPHGSARIGHAPWATRR